MIGGGKFSNGAFGGAMTHLFNAEGGALVKPKRNLAWDTDGNGRLSMEEANNWFRNGNGRPIDVDASKLTVLDLEDHDIVMYPSDYAAHGQVSLSPNGGIYNSTYDFEPHEVTGWGTIFRNEATIWGSVIAGDGQAYETRFYNKPTVWKF